MIFTEFQSVLTSNLSKTIGRERNLLSLCILRNIFNVYEANEKVVKSKSSYLSCIVIWRWIVKLNYRCQSNKIHPETDIFSYFIEILQFLISSKSNGFGWAQILIIFLFKKFIGQQIFYVLFFSFRLIRFVLNFLRM